MGALLESGAFSLGVELSGAKIDKLLRYLDLLLAWNRKVNLTAITDPREAIEGHLVDALGAAGATRELDSVIDIGTGGGVPGIPLAILHPEQQWRLVETVHKKVGFLKAVVAQLGLSNVRACQVRAMGHPDREGLEFSAGAISRAFCAPDAWFDLARHYVRRPGRLIAMVSDKVRRDDIARAFPHSLSEKSFEPLIEHWEYRLPRADIRRQVFRLTID